MKKLPPDAIACCLQKCHPCKGLRLAKIDPLQKQDGKHSDDMQDLSPATNTTTPDVDQSLHGHDDNECKYKGRRVVTGCICYQFAPVSTHHMH